MEILATQLIIRHLIPHASAISTNFHALRPPTPTIRPSRQFDLAVVDHHVFVDGRHDRGGDGHGLDAEAVGVSGVVFADLGRVVEVFFHLDGGQGRVFDHVDPGQPFA
jgi:hypothetical protein